MSGTSAINGIRTRITIGSRQVLRCPELVVSSRRHAPLTSAYITLPDPTGALYSGINDGEAVEIIFGYRDKTPATWQGTVAGLVPGNKDQVVVRAIGIEKPLSTVTVCQSWENETTEAIIRYAIKQSGLAVGRIDSPGVVIPRFSAATIPVWQVARQCAVSCQKAFGLDMSGWALWVGKDGKVNWGDFDEPGDMPVIATGAGLIKHLPATNRQGAALSMVETFLLPDLMHSQRFTLRDRRRDINDTFRALNVRHVIKERSSRTFIEYGIEYDFC